LVTPRLESAEPDFAARAGIHLLGMVRYRFGPGGSAP